ncbi:MAG TPA: hypothetical protein VGL03_10035 [Thermoanaerobaculia bacterium]
MSVLAGFDLVIEVSRETVLELAKANVEFGGQSINPPFEIFVPVAYPGASGLGHLIVHKVDLMLAGDRDVMLAFFFHNSSVIVDPPLSITASLLDGTMGVKATLELVDSGKPLKKVVSADLSNATVNLQFSDAAEARIASALAGKPLDPATFKSLARQKAESYVRAVGRQTLPLEFQVEPGKFGSVSDGIFERLELHNILGTPNMFFQFEQAVGLFGMLLPGIPSGDHSQKDGPAILSGHDLAFSVSARAFHRLVFCPAIAAPAKLSVAELPPSCGSGGGIDRDGVTLTSISDTFADGRIDVNGTVEKSGTCYDAHGSFHAAVTFSIVAGQLVANTAVDTPSIVVEIPWYCQLATALLGPIGLIISGIVSSSMDDSIQKMKSMTDGLAGKGMTFGTGGFGGAKFDDVAVSPEGLTLHGFAPEIYLPLPQSPGISIEGSVVTDGYVGGSQGSYTVEAGCLEGTYPYTEVQQAQIGTYVAVPTLLGRPLQLEWRVEKINGYVSKFAAQMAVFDHLKGAGTTVVGSVNTHYPLPLPDGLDVVQDVHVGYTAGKVLVLKNTPPEGCFGLKVSVIALDPMGQSVSATSGVQFDGDVVEIGGGYHEKLAECIRFWIGVAEGYKLQDRVPRWVPVNYPPEAQLVEFIRFMFAVDTPEAQELLPHVRLAHGTSYTRALLSREAAGPSSLRGRQKQR